MADITVHNGVYSSWLWHFHPQSLS